MTLPFRPVSIHGVPRSGTSWVGQMFNSHPGVAYRYQPLFSYRFKDAISPTSTDEEIHAFLQDVMAADDDPFLTQQEQQQRGAHPQFIKGQPTHLVMKMVRYHHVIERMITAVPDIAIIGIIRHPAATINSWLKTPREFLPEWDPQKEWRDASSKNQGKIEEYYGYNKWKEFALLIEGLAKQFPDNVLIARYEDIVERTTDECQRIFSFCGLEMNEQTQQFILKTHTREVDDPDTVFRTKDVSQRWETELDEQIRDAILRDLANSPLKRYTE